MSAHNFSAGPCVLPREVLAEAAEAVRAWHPAGLSLLEISHRDPLFVEVMEEARSLVLELLGLDATEYTSLFLQGGASSQFFAVAYNFLDSRAAYVNTGTWSSKAIKEAEHFGEIIVAGSSESTGFDRIPNPLETLSDVDYFHLTTNNTIYGTQWTAFPKPQTPLVADMSSDLLSRVISPWPFDFIYAGAQKNLGPAGATLVVLRNAMLDRICREVPSMLDYRRLSEKESMYNTPPVFAVYVCLLNLRWLKSIGGVEAVEQMNREKASLMYSEIDRNSLFHGVARETDRSAMNATFRLKDSQLQNKFDELWKEGGIYGLKGHRSVGGYRASMYNALNIESVKTLVDIMKHFENQYG